MAFDFSSLRPVQTPGAQPPQFVRKLGGANQSLLVRDELNDLWVIKRQNGAKPTNHIANEVLGSHICDVLGIPTPRTKAMQLSPDFFEDQRTWLNTLENPLQRTPGLHFASRYLPQLISQEMINNVPGTLVPCIINSNDCLGMFILDVWAKHRDTRQVLYELCGKGLKAIFIDNGELFGGARWGLSEAHVHMAPTHRAVLFIRNRTELIQQWVARMRERLPTAMTFAIKQLPSCWFCNDAEALVDRFLRELDSLPRQVALAISALERQIGLTPRFAQDQSGRRWVTILDPAGNTHYSYMD